MSVDNEAVLVERIGRVLVATINRPEARNAVTRMSRRAWATLWTKPIVTTRSGSSS